MRRFFIWSALAAVIGLYMLGPDEEFGAEIYSGATSQDQAMEVFRPALLMAKASNAVLLSFMGEAPYFLLLMPVFFGDPAIGCVTRSSHCKRLA